MSSILLLVGLVVGAVFTGLMVTCCMVLWVRGHSCSCSFPCPCKDPTDHNMCGPHKDRWVRFCPYKLTKVCSCRWKDECKSSLSEVVFREERKKMVEDLTLDIFENEKTKKSVTDESDSIDSEQFHSTTEDDKIILQTKKTTN